MASWVTHIRIVEKLVEFNKDLNNKLFLIGNIAPDWGRIQYDGSYYPTKEITHWKIGKGKYDLERFKDTYLNGKNDNMLFYLGYYLHLITDLEWIKMYKEHLESKDLVERFYNDKKFVKEYKNDWYTLDFNYLKNNNNSIFFKEFVKINKFDNIYFNNYHNDIFTEQINLIKEYYLNDKSLIDRECLYFFKEDMDNFLDRVRGILSKEVVDIL